VLQAQDQELRLKWLTIAEVFFRNGNYLFFKCCRGVINYCLNTCRLKSSTPQTPKCAKRACQCAQEQVQERYKPKYEKNLEKNDQYVKKILFFDSEKIKVSRARTEGK